MEPRVVLVMHEPLASAYAACAAHVLNGVPTALTVIDIPADLPPAEGEARVAKALADGGPVLVLSDVAGATPYNMAWRAVRDARVRGLDAALLAGVNVCALFKALSLARQGAGSVGTAGDWVAAVHAAGHRGIVDADAMVASGCG